MADCSSVCSYRENAEHEKCGDILFHWQVIKYL